MQDVLTGGLMLTGALFMLAGSLGVLRMPDLFTRMHAASLTDTLGASLVIFGIMLQAVTWQILNEKDSGNFNRNSLVIYTMEKLPDGSTREHGYAFTEPGAERLGVNLKWMLVNCSVVARDQARPEL